jgi:hypothetical protein
MNLNPICECVVFVLACTANAHPGAYFSYLAGHLHKGVVIIWGHCSCTVTVFGVCSVHYFKYAAYAI